MKRLLFLALLLCCLPAWADPFKDFEGDTASDKTDVFVLEGPWKLSWDFQGTALRVEIYEDGQEASANPIRQVGPGKGSMTMKKGGRYWLQIESVGHYHLHLETLSKASASLPVFEGNLERKGTAIFHGPPGWKFRCSGQGVLKVTLYDSKRNQVGEPVALLGGGETVRKVGTEGDYFFMVQSTGPYKIEVLK